MKKSKELNLKQKDRELYRNLNGVEQEDSDSELVDDTIFEAWKKSSSHGSNANKDTNTSALVLLDPINSNSADAAENAQFVKLWTAISKFEIPKVGVFPSLCSFFFFSVFEFYFILIFNFFF